jgi:hypothetical protein
MGLYVNTNNAAINARRNLNSTVGKVSTCIDGCIIGVYIKSHYFSLLEYNLVNNMSIPRGFLGSRAQTHLNAHPWERSG